jgi:ankyrin repeat protein
MTETDLQKACRVGDSGKIREIVVSNPGLINELDQNLGWPPLYRTVTCGHVEASKVLLSLGANPNTKNKLGDSPLHQAVESNHIVLVQLLLDSGADSNIQQNDGDTPLHYSCLKEFAPITNLLLKYRANPNLQDKIFGKTPFHLAVESKNLAMVQMMIKYSARFDIEDYSGRTPLELSEDIKNLVESYIERDPDAMSKKTPSFDHSEISVKADSIIEPECENLNFAKTGSFNDYSFGTDPHKSSLYKWLTSMKLEDLYNILYINGYDDLDFLLAQIRSTDPLTLEILEKIGVSKYGHRAKLLALLEEEAFKDIRNSLPAHNCIICSNRPSNSITLEKWLDSIGLKKLLKNFVDNGVEDMETLITIMQSKYAFCDETLKGVLDIEKLGHRQRIMGKIKEELGTPVVRHRRVVSKMSIEKDEQVTACEFCLAF